MQKLDFNNKKDQMIESLFCDWFEYMERDCRNLANDRHYRALKKAVEVLNAYERLYTELVYGPAAEPDLSALSEFLPK
jgi:hypothetical protein